MHKRQFIALCICSFIPICVGTGLVPLLPIYAIQLGATPAMVGNYLSFVYLALAIGTVSAGWLSNKLQRRRVPLMVMSIIATPATWLMGYATTIGQLAMLTCIVWFMGGAVLALVNILAGLYAQKSERGRVFGALGLAAALGGFVGGMTTGPLVDRWGYSTLFTVLATLWLVALVSGLLLQDRHVVVARAGEQPAAAGQVRLGYALIPLLLVNLLAGIVSFVGVMGRSIAMDAQGFTATAVTMTWALAAGAGLIFNPLLGSLSDRVDRKLLLVLSYAGGGLSLVMLAMAASLVDFTVVALLVAIAAADRAIAAALIADLLPPRLLDRGLSLFDAAKWAGGIFGFAGTGYSVQLLGLPTTLMLGALLSVIAIVLLAFVRQASAAAVVSRTASSVSWPLCQGAPIGALPIDERVTVSLYGFLCRGIRKGRSLVSVIYR